MARNEAQLIREVESHKATALAYGEILAAVERAAQNVAPRTVAADVFREETARLRSIVDEMTRGACEAFGELVSRFGEHAAQ